MIAASASNCWRSTKPRWVSRSVRVLKTYPALASVRMPAGAEVLAVVPRPDPTQAASLVVLADPSESKMTERVFRTLEIGDSVPAGARPLGQWRGTPTGRILCLFEFPADVPDGLSEEYVPHYRNLIDDGFTLRDDLAWIAPPSVPPGRLSRDQIIAVAMLQECGFGSVVF